jgi:hypothetical protein
MTKMITQYNKTVPATEALPHARLHDLRHLHATTLLLAGASVHVVAARLGHADPAVSCGSTLMCSASMIWASETFSPRPSGLRLANPLASPDAKLDHHSVSAGESGGGQGGVEPPTFRFSGLGMTVGDGPLVSACLLTDVQWTHVDVRVLG